MFWRYPVASVTGVGVVVACVLLAIQLSTLFADVEEVGFAATFLGASLGLSLGGFLAGRIIGPATVPKRSWLKCVLVSPGLWLAMLLLGSSSQHYGATSEYFVELIAPALIGVAIAAAAAAWGASKWRAAHP